MGITPAEKRTKRVTIQAPTQTPDANGQLIETWADVAAVWAAVTPLSARELIAAKQAQSRATHRLKILYRPGITSAMRAVLGSRVFHFDAVLNRDEANEELEILAMENV